MSELRRLLAEHDIARLLSPTEVEIFRRASRGHGLRGIASLYGFSGEAAAQREVDRIVLKLCAALGLAVPADVAARAPAVAAAGNGGGGVRPPPAAPPAPVSTSGGAAPADRPTAVLRALADGALDSAALAARTGIARSTLSEVVSRLRRQGRLVTVTDERDRRRSVHRLAPVGESATSAPEPLPAPRAFAGVEPPTPDECSALDIDFAAWVALLRPEVERIEREAGLLEPLRRLLQAAEDCVAG